MGAGLLSQFMFMAVTAANHTTGLRPWKCTPSVAYGDVSPRESVSHDSQSPAAPYESCSLATPEGEILAALYLELLMNSNAERQENFPLRGKWCAAPKGVHFQRAAGAVVWFAIGRSPVVKVLGREAAIIIAPEGRHHNLLNPLNLLNLLNLGREAAPLGDTTTLSGEAAVKPKNPPAAGRSILRTFLSQPFYTTCGKAAPPYF